MKRNKGFSLVELLVSIAILAIIMVMVVQFMGTASVSIRRTRKKMDLQTEAIEFREQLSDVLMQASYVRIQAKDLNGYQIYTGLQTANVNKERKRVEIDDPSAGTKKNITSTPLATAVSSLTYVSDDYPTFDNIAQGKSDKLDIYFDRTDFTMVGKAGDGKKYPSSIDKTIRSFRLLKGTVNGQPYYVKPEYIYIIYPEAKDASGTVIENEQCVIYHFKDTRVYMYKGDVVKGASDVDGFNNAKTQLNNTGDKDTNDRYNGLLVDLVNEVYVSVDTASNAILVSAQLYDTEQPRSQRGTDDSAYTKYIYDFEDSIVLRNSHALSAAPNRLYECDINTVTTP